MLYACRQEMRILWQQQVNHQQARSLFNKILHSDTLPVGRTGYYCLKES